MTVHRYLRCVNIKPGDLLVEEGGFDDDGDPVDMDELDCQACIDGAWDVRLDEEPEPPPVPPTIQAYSWATTVASTTTTTGYSLQIQPTVPGFPHDTDCDPCARGEHLWAYNADGSQVLGADWSIRAVRCHCGAWRPGTNMGVPM